MNSARSPSRCWRYGWRYSFARSAVVCRTSSIFSEYGRVARTDCCARRIRVAATTCMALVIFWMFWVLRMRRRMSRREGIRRSGSLDAVLGVEGLDRLFDLGLDLLVPLLVGLDRPEQRLSLGVEKPSEGCLPLHDLVGRDLVEVPTGPGVDGADLHADVDGLELVLDQELAQSLPPLELAPGAGVP